MKVSDLKHLKQAVVQRRLRERLAKVRVERGHAAEPRLPHEHDESPDSQPPAPVVPPPSSKRPR